MRSRSEGLGLGLQRIFWRDTIQLNATEEREIFFPVKNSTAHLLRGSVQIATQNEVRQSKQLAGLGQTEVHKLHLW